MWRLFRNCYNSHVANLGHHGNPLVRLASGIELCIVGS